MSLTEASFSTCMFLLTHDVLGRPTMRSFYHDVVNLQGVDKSLNQKCIAKTEPSKCMFPQEFLKNIRTPIFFVNAAYDFWLRCSYDECIRSKSKYLRRKPFQHPN